MNEFKRIFRYTADWKPVKLSTIVERVSERNAELNDNVLTISAQHGLVKQELFFNKRVASKDLSNYYVLQRGDFAYNKSYSKGYPFGAIKRLEHHDKGVVSPLYICFRAKPSNGNADYLNHLFEAGALEEGISSIAKEGARAHGLVNVGIGDFLGLPVCIPETKAEQIKIAEILSTVDRAIEQTDTLIAKQQRIKAGLMQDLLTRGIDENGNVRSERTHAFKDSPLGRIPVEWEARPLGDLVASAVDGPFGSNLKTEHYVDEPGVRVIRLQNLGNGQFIDTDKVWVSRERARRLERHSVAPGDLLIGSLGDDKRLFGRACLYPASEQPAIVKADVFRVRCKREAIIHGFAFRLFNLPRWRRGLFGLAQGVTRDRVNLSNLMLFKLPVPGVDEQRFSASYLDAADEHLYELQRSLKKMCSLKTGLMQDLLTGKCRVTAFLTQLGVASA